MEKRILIVEDEKPIVDILKFNLNKEGYKVMEAYNGQDGLNLALQQKPDLILLDVMLPEIDGFTVCKKIREKTSIPILMLTAKEEEIDKILGLELGADDYITKPFSVRELVARIKTNLRRSVYEDEEEKNVIVKKELVIYLDEYEIKKNDKVIDLTIREFELIKFLAMQPGQIFTRQQLLEKVWGYEYFGDARTVDVTIRRLREKIESNPAEPFYILTKRGVGYYFNREVEN